MSAWKRKRSLMKSEFVLRDFLNPNPNTVSLSASCFLVEVQTKEQIFTQKSS